MPITGNISAKYYENPTMLSRVIAKNIGDVFFETQCILVSVGRWTYTANSLPSRSERRSMGHFVN